MKKTVLTALTLALSLTAVVAPVSAKEATKPVEKTVTVGADTLHYYEHQPKGKKAPEKTFLVMHGAFMNSVATNGLAEQLAKKYPQAQVVQLDLPSHGKSTSTTGPKNTVDEIASTVGQAVEEMREDGSIKGDLVPVGWSMGGSTAIKMALQGVDMEAMVLLNTAPDWKVFQGFDPLDGETILGAFSGTFAGDIAIGLSKTEAAKWVAKLPKMVSGPATARADVNALLAFDVHKELKNIDVPTVIISADLDPVASLDAQKEMQSSIPNVLATKIIKGDGHSVMMKQPKEVVQAIAKEIKK